LVSSKQQQTLGIKLTTTTPWYQVNNNNTLVSSKIKQHLGIKLTTTPWYQVNYNNILLLSKQQQHFGIE